MTPDAVAICAEIRAAIVRTGFSETARRSGLDRTMLHRAFPAAPKGRVPALQTVTKVAEALGLEVTVRKRPEPAPRDLAYSPDGDGGYDR